jgi:peptidoglycan-N-acetylglucosamine deacetylase
MRKFIIFALLSVCFLAVCGYGLLQVSKSRTFQFFGDIVNRVDTEEKIIALTFDDGPETYTNEVLDMLQEKQVKVTFYVIGERLQDSLKIGKRIVSEGHELGNHSYTHQRFLLKPQSFIDSEIQKTNQLIREAGYEETITFRPPYGKKIFGLPWYLSKHNIVTIMFDVEPDTYGTTSDFIVEYTVANSKAGSIILLHPFCETCSEARKAVPIIIDKLQEEGYVFVTISDLLSRR